MTSIFQNKDQVIANGATAELQRKRLDIFTLLEEGIQAVDPVHAVKQVIVNNTIQTNAQPLDLASFQKIFVVGFGKASVGMAQAVLNSISIDQAVVITNDTQAKSSFDNLEIVVGGHPLPNQGSILGAQKIINLVQKCTEKDLVIVLISGGGSALFCHPRVPLNDMQQATDVLMKAGADIKELNTVRKHLSEVKGGQLATKTQAQLVSLIISDVINDPLEFIASGPTAPDTTTFEDALSIIHTYKLADIIPKSVLHVLKQGVKKTIVETPKQDHSCFKRVSNTIVASNKRACTQMMQTAKRLGYQPVLYAADLQGEAKNIAPQLVAKAAQLKSDEKALLLSGGETTVTVHGKGKGGRNQELVMSMAPLLENSSMVAASFGTDGIDGNSDAAGAIADGNTMKNTKQKKVSYEHLLQNNDSYHFFKSLNDLLITGPTGTNVMDLQIIIP